LTLLETHVTLTPEFEKIFEKEGNLMKRLNLYLGLAALFIVLSIIIIIIITKKSTPTPNPQILLETSLGAIQLELFADKAPITVKNFLRYVDANFYANILFHRVIPDFMIQGGGFVKGMSQKQTGPPIKNEAGNGLSNLRGAIAMARTPDLNSATSQFFINVHDNPFLDHRDNTIDGFGYCVFGQVINGMDVVDKVARVSTGSVGPFEDVPLQDVMIISVTRVK
jgi:cyclophilin family peptidyl-prolyl cis-trans isomerase